MAVFPDQAAIRSGLSAELDRLLAILDRRGDIVEVWLLGSLVDDANHLHADSDIDLVLVQETARPPIERALVLREALAPREPLDLFVYTPDEMAAGSRFTTHVRRYGRRLR